MELRHPFRCTALVAAVVACGDGTSPATVAEVPQRVSSPARPRVTATLRGVVRSIGEPRLGVIDVTPTDCGGRLMSSPVLEQFEVNDDRTLPWVFVHVVAGPSLTLTDVAPKPAVVAQKDCTYRPHVVGVVAGQEVVFKNDDEVPHTFHVVPSAANRPRSEWDRTLDSGATESYHAAGGFGVRLVCDLHSWTRGWMHVLDHPYFAVSARGTGRYEIRGLSPGPHTLRAWHETWARAKPVEFTVDLRAGENVHDIDVDVRTAE